MKARDEDRIKKIPNVIKGKPEFPPLNPNFPATPTYKINVPGFSNVWLKDESYNPTGTHKDRMAWEVVLTYKRFMKARMKGLHEYDLPHFSIISSGSAALAIQVFLNTFDLPHLKVIVDAGLDRIVVDKLRNLGCDVYLFDLSRKVLDSEDILRITQNRNGIDLTSGDAFEATTYFYDWLAYEILNNKADHCFVPYGSGFLYENILRICKKEVEEAGVDSRLKITTPSISKCNFYGATTNNPKSLLAEKLYAPHLPFIHFNEQWIRLYKLAGFCGLDSGVSIVSEEFVLQAIKILESQEQEIRFEYSAVAGLALFLEKKNIIQPNEKVLIINTGKANYSVRTL